MDDLFDFDFSLLDDLAGCEDIWAEFQAEDNDVRDELSSGDSQDVPQPKKKLITKPRVPRLLNRDIRKAYGRMLTNVTNSCDSGLMRSFFLKHCCGNVSITHSTQRNRVIKDNLSQSFNNGSSVQLSAPHQSSQFHVNGVQALAEFFIGNTLMMPDLAVQCFKSEVLHTVQGAGSKIRMQSTISGTRCFDLPIDVWIPSLCGSSSTIRAVEGSGSSAAIEETAAPSSTNSSLSGVSEESSVGSKRKLTLANGTTCDAKKFERQYLAAATAALKPLSEAQTFTMRSNCLLHLDANNCITSIEISMTKLAV